MNITDSKFNNLTIICNGCGNKMKNMGIWPVQYPKEDGLKNIQMSHRYLCETCKTPHANYEKGVPVLIAIILED